MAKHEIEEKELEQQDGASGANGGAAGDESGEGIVEQSVPAAEYHKLEQEKNALLDRLARLQAEFDNYRKRSAKEQADFRDYAVADAAKAFLPVLDSFDLALRSSAQSETGLRSGVELIRKQFEDALTRIGVQSVPAKGEQFDPRLHEAIEMVETSEFPDHQVIEELQRGYKIKERLLRPAMVRVAQNHSK